MFDTSVAAIGAAIRSAGIDLSVRLSVPASTSGGRDTKPPADGPKAEPRTDGDEGSGRDLSAVTVSSVEFDSRLISPGSLFVAIAGEHVDGHDFASAAQAAGAAAVLGHSEIAQSGSTLPLLLVADQTQVLAAMGAVARASVAALVELGGLTVIGVTGSSGKTSTKDLIAAVLRAHPSAVGLPDAVVAPPESFNNELGHPWTALRAGLSTRFLVLELSARGPGHIAALAAVAPPKIGAVLNVGTAHLGEFGSVDGIAAAKGELVEALPSEVEGGVAILNADDGRVLAMAARTTAAVVTVGTGPNSIVRAVDIGQDDRSRPTFTLVTPEGRAPVALAVAGAHQLGNALTAAAVGRATGMDVDSIARALSAAGPVSRWRMEISERADGVTVINDAYNANPDSMKAALRALATIGSGRRTWAVLGEMGELGEHARAAHDEIGRLVVRLGIDGLIVVGERARALHLGAHLEGSWGGESEIVADVEAATSAIISRVAPGDVVLIKASRSVGLQRAAAKLLAAEPLSAAVGPAGAAETAHGPRGELSRERT